MLTVNSNRMCVEVLQFKSEIDQARGELSRRGLSCLTTNSRWQSILRRLGLAKEIPVGDYLKSWDVLRTATFINERMSRDAPILDIGAYASEILCVLHRLGYTNLTGIDVDPKLIRMPYADVIRYKVSDLMHTPFQSGSFEVIAAISVIEHGFDSQTLLAEMSRLLRPGGYFIASFDYWPEKVEATDVRFFGMDWRIFSEHEVLAFIDRAHEHRLTPIGNVHLKARERTIQYAERSYTFAWLVLRKG